MAVPALAEQASARQRIADARGYDTIKKMSAWHEALLDVMLARPDITKLELARVFGVSHSWISRVTTSDTFQAEYAKRREMISNALATDLKDKLLSVTEAALDEIDNRLTDRDKAAMIATRELTDIASKGARALGYGDGGGKKNSATVVNNVLLVDQKDLQDAQTRMRTRASSSGVTAVVPESGGGVDAPSDAGAPPLLDYQQEETLSDILHTAEVLSPRTSLGQDQDGEEA